MSTVILPSKDVFSLLVLFFSEPSSRYYLREIARLIKRPVGSVQRYLAGLEGEGILLTRKEGHLKYFQLNDNFPYYSELESIVLREKRKAELEKNLKVVIKEIKKHYKPEKLILFGSLAGGRVSPESDIDLLIIKKDIPKRYPERIKELAPFIAISDVGIDFTIWTPEELANEKDTNNFLREEILKKGKVIYERAA